ncbi:Zn-dependent oxidoreductase [Roseivirga seohaensis subsp. aquiponti]|uniref:Zn-dependent oxidoreductase n=1 Tax=Roseivirga seohaensis subsp. aquiponti TaxID=1566026 RepID=A0A0L8AQD9_9BACT|nr:NAD(P)-dependent alcohol dehydrogenase [Roseivirga seohaensis]KOF04407.1 Zn-dependent oxidoreductase [Roseivirga seohaensis subsp. aquiponti]
MKAIEYHNYGSPEVLQIVEREIPTPKDNEILVKIFATTVTATETTFRQGKPYFSRLFTGLRKPKIKTLGEELAGEIIETGKAVTLFKKGDRIFGTAGPTFGANAEYITLPEDAVIVPLPSNLNYEESASTCDGFLTALPFLRDTGKIKKGEKVLIYGASGSVGSSAIQVAKYYGAEVTGVCSTTNLELVSSLGADHVIDYKNEDFTKNGQQYDIIFDAVGKIKYSKAKKALTKEGRFLEAGIGFNVLGHVLITALFGKKKALIATTGLRPPAERTKDLHLLKSLLEEGRIKPVIDKTYTFSNIAEAHRYVDLGHKKGNVVIRMV